METKDKVNQFFKNFNKVYSTTVKIYNSVCPSCRLRLVQTSMQNKRLNANSADTNMKLTLENLCPNCKVIYNDIVKGK